MTPEEKHSYAMAAMDGLKKYSDMWYRVIYAINNSNGQGGEMSPAQ